MSNKEEVEKLVKKLEKKQNLKPYEKKFLEIYNKEKCDEEEIRNLILAGRDKYVERNYKADIKQAGRNFLSGAKEGGQSLKGSWKDAPPPPPSFPEDCVIM